MENQNPEIELTTGGYGHVRDAMARASANRNALKSKKSGFKDYSKGSSLNHIELKYKTPSEEELEVIKKQIQLEAKQSMVKQLIAFCIVTGIIACISIVIFFS